MSVFSIVKKYGVWHNFIEVIFMKFLFKGDITDLKYGIKEIADHLSVILSEDGCVIDVRKKEGDSFTVCFKDGKGEIIYGKVCHFFRAFGILV